MPTESETPIPEDASLSDEEESDTEAEDIPAEDEAELSQDTEVVAHPNDIGEQFYADDRCLVRLSTRSNGRALLCGHTQEACQRRRHDILRADPAKRGQPGLYMATWNASRTVGDAVEETHRDREQQAAAREENRRLMAEMGSEQKDQTEEDLQERNPSVVTFGGVEETKSPEARSATPRRDQMNFWTSNLRPEPSPAARGENGFPPLTGGTNPTTDPTLLRILDKMVDKFDEFQTLIQENQREIRDHFVRAPPKNTPPTPNPTGAVPEHISIEASVSGPNPGKKPTRWYAVAKGRKTGVFTRWSDVIKSVRGVEGAIHKRFHNEEHAHRWLSERLEPHELQWGGDEWSLDGTQVEPAAREEPKEDLRRPQYYNTVIDPTKIGGDRSVGKDREMFETSIEVEADVLKLLCPKGVTEEVRRELVEAAPDIIALPGKSSQSTSTVGESAMVIDQISEALGNLTVDQARKQGYRTPRDTQWRLPSRNAMKNLKTAYDLNEATEELGSLSANVLGNMDMIFKDILATAGWASEDSELYCTSGILPRIIRDTYVKYHQLHIHLQGVALKHPERWNEITLTHINHHSKNLARIRQFAVTKTQYLVQVYIYLRDAKARSFRDLKLLNTITEDLEARLEAAEPREPATEDPGYTCAHCRGSFHEGGRRSCPLAEFKVRKARQIATEYARVVPPDPSALERLIAQARENLKAVDNPEIHLDKIEHYQYRVKDGQPRAQPPSSQPLYKIRYGTAGLGLDVTPLAWTDWEPAFSSGPHPDWTKQCPGRPQTTTVEDVARLPTTFLADHPVDVLVLGLQDPERHRRWLHLVGKVRYQCRPRIVVEYWDQDHLLFDDGPMSKGVLTAWTHQGYSDSSCRLVHNLQVGGVVQCTKLVVFRQLEEPDGGANRQRQDGQQGDLAWPPVNETTVRPMENCLRFCGIPKKAYDKTGRKSDLPYSLLDSMPEQPGSWIRTPRGVRRLLNDELARGLGVPDRWLQRAYPTGRLLRQTVPLHMIEYLSPLLVDKLLPVVRFTPIGLVETPGTQTASSEAEPTLPDQDTSEIPFHWTPPDLGPHSDWTRQRVLRLLRACLQYPDPGAMIEEGMLNLRKHRENYDSQGPAPSQLQVLWWEFPPEVWDSLREGSSMHFLHDPPVGLTPNSPMTEEQICIAEEFVDELVELGVLIPTPAEDVWANGPLFTVPKPGQPGQWRIISDMRSGGQNAVSAADPTVFPKAGNVLDQMYTGGWTAVVDASKFFYQFTTKTSERKFLGCLHPRDPKLQYVYGGLPMGATASPAHAGRYGTAMIRRLRDSSSLFQGRWRLNTWWSHYAFGQRYDPSLGHGLVRMGIDGLPAVQVWAHCDDFLIHGPTLAKTTEAVRAFLDMTVQVGMLCNPAKLTPPAAQAVRYTGFTFDTQGIPTIRVPAEKCSRAMALTTYGIDHERRISRLALAVIVGTLESLVEATPDRIGHTYLRHIQHDLHPTGWDGPDLPYYSHAKLSPDSLDELRMWLWILQTNPGRRARGGCAGTLIPSFGDGSGTGTGGTVLYPDMTSFEMWMGTWDPTVFHFSSNWKELRTLQATLERAAQRPDRDRLRGTTFFYFTDNLVTYYVVTGGTSTSPELHQMVLSIKRLSLTLGVQLEVVHVPGTLIILEGTDGLSRGIWATRAHSRPEPHSLLSHIFAPVTVTPGVLEWASARIPPLRHTLCYRRWSEPWDAASILNRHTFWAPPPEIAAQLLSALLQLYVERPQTTSALILVPRVLQRRWSRLSRHVLEIGVYDPDDWPCFTTVLTPIPLVLLYIPPHTLRIEPRRLDRSAPTALQRSHQHIAALVRGLQGRPPAT